MISGRTCIADGLCTLACAVPEGCTIQQAMHATVQPFCMQHHLPLLNQVPYCHEPHRAEHRMRCAAAGHSLGAALATVFAQVLRARRPELADKIAGVYAFAAPRVGDTGFARSVNDAYSGRAYRIAYGADIIPHLPPMFLEYRDAGEEVFITSFGSVLRDPKVSSRSLNDGFAGSTQSQQHGAARLMP